MPGKNEILITIAAPMYNEEELITEFIEEICRVVKSLEYEFELLLVNDGSNDQTVSRVLSCDSSIAITVIDLSRNFGHPVATQVCLENARGDLVILMDSDLQDDPAVIPEFIGKYEEGYDVVYAVRSARESRLKKYCFRAYYKLVNFLSEVELPLESGNFSLMSRRVVDKINEVKIRNRYLPGIRAFVGFKQTGIAVPRRRRHAGKSKVGLNGQLKLAFNGIFSFSYLPIRIFHLIGTLSILLSIVLMIFAIYAKFGNVDIIPAWTSQIIAISFFSGVIIFGIGIVGEYVVRMSDEIRALPKYVVREVLYKGRQDG